MKFNFKSFMEKIKFNKTFLTTAITSVLLAMICVFVSVILKSSTIIPVMAPAEEIESKEQSSSQAETKQQEEPDNGIRLVINSPENDYIKTENQDFSISGTCDRQKPLLLNGSEVSVSEDGSFNLQFKLDIGLNTFTFEHKGESKTISVNYRYVVINGYNPSTDQIYSSGSTIVVNVSARVGSQVTATLGNTVSQLKATHSNSQQENSVSEFQNYSTSFKLPSNNIEDLNLGKIKYSASYNGISETFYSGKITCKKSDIIVSSDPAATPKGGNYINVGSGYVAEITAPFAETFNGNTTDDWSRPTNNYLPKGTVDYCSTGLVYDALSDMNFVTLRCGRRVYLEKQDPPDKTKTAVVKRYIATLPDHNEITVSGLTSSGRHTVLTLNTLFKAPFYFDLHNQNYTNPATQNYTVSALTFSYVDITFCYATVFGGEVELPPDNPVFSSAQIIRGPYDTTLRLFLKVPGKFYGWDAYYNSNGQLCFEFLNPVQINDADNAYGTSLSGAKIFIDAGHGGIDCGALAYNRAYTEANRNLNLALKVKQRLEALGAEVIISRSGDTTLTAQNRMLMLKNAKPDLCVSIHHDSNNKSQLNGFSAYHFNAFSKTAAQYVYNRTYNTGIYSNYQLKWHYFFLARVTTCPVVLTENGYMSSPADFGNIQNDSANNAKADAITSGIVDYFRSIKQ